MERHELLTALDRLKSIMIAVATGGPRINEMNSEFAGLYDSVSEELSRRGIKKQLPYRDLWEWYGRWSSGDLPSYQSRRQFVNELFAPFGRSVAYGGAPIEPTGWRKVDQTVGEMRADLERAIYEVHFQGVGLSCREALISLAQAIYKPDRHGTLDGVQASDTDAKRMIEAYFAHTLSGQSHEHQRKHARAALDLAVSLQHKRTAGFRDAALCVEATTSVINIVAIVDGRRDPKPKTTIPAHAPSLEAPGLIWRREGSTWEARWLAPTDAIETGYPLESVLLFSGGDPDEFEREWILDRCKALQDEAATWKPRAE